MSMEMLFFVEGRDNGVWKSCDNLRLVGDPMSFDVVGNDFYKGSNEELFAMLAGLDPQRINTIAHARGLPKDLSPELTDVVEQVFRPGTAASWLSLVELLVFDWEQKLEIRATVNGPVYEQWSRSDPERDYHPPVDSISNRKPRIRISERTMAADITSIKKRHSPDQWGTMIEQELGNCFCNVTRSWTYAQKAGSFYNQTLPRMEEQGISEDVRCVFWFVEE